MPSTVPFARKRKTDYKLRLRLLSSGVPRLVVRQSLKHMLLQVVQFTADGDRVIAHAHTAELKKLGWSFGTGNTPAAYLAGYLLGKRLKDHPRLIADIGSRTKVKGAKMFAAIKGAIDAGIEIPHDASIFPDTRRLTGEHIAAYAAKRPFSQDVTRMPELVAKVKKAIDNGG